VSRRWSGRQVPSQTVCPECGVTVQHSPHARWTREGGVTRCSHRGRVYHVCEVDGPAVDAQRLAEQLRSLPKAQPGRGHQVTYKEGP
jgi:hypothetical protein